MPYLQTQDIKYIARLARIRLKEEQIEKLTKQLDEILGYVAQLKSLNTENIPPTSHILSLKNVFRDNNVKQSLQKQDALRGAPSNQGDFFKVPKVI